MTFADGNKYDGEWKEGRKSGLGIFTWANGAKYSGDFKDGKQNGSGAFFWPNGARYEGEWKDNKQNGQGTYYYTNGAFKTGRWVDGNLVPEAGANIKPISTAPEVAMTSKVSNEQPSVSIDGAKAKCKDLGFKLGTDDFGKCVLQLTK